MDLQLYFGGIALLLVVFSGVWLMPLVGLAVAVADLLCHTMAASWRQNDQLFGRSRLAFSGISAHFRPQTVKRSAISVRHPVALSRCRRGEVTEFDAAA
jgi:hypothetical protein